MKHIRCRENVDESNVYFYAPTNRDCKKGWGKQKKPFKCCSFCLIESSCQIGKVLNVRRKNLAPRANSIDSKSLVQIAVPHVLRRTQAIVASFLEKGHTASRSLEAERWVSVRSNDKWAVSSEQLKVISFTLLLWKGGPLQTMLYGGFRKWRRYCLWWERSLSLISDVEPSVCLVFYIERALVVLHAATSW